MSIIEIKTYRKFLSKHKLYTFINIFGFSVSLMFILLLGRYIEQELSVDDFQKNKDRIYLFASVSNTKTMAALSNMGAEYIKAKIPEVESFTRIVQRSVDVKVGNAEKTRCKALLADSTFFQVFSFPLYDGTPSTAINTKYSAVLSRSYSRKLFGSDYPVGKTIEVDNRQVTVTGLMEDFPSNSQIGKSDMVLNYRMAEHYWGDDILTSWNNASFACYFLAKAGTDLRTKESIVLEGFKQDNWVYKGGFANGLAFVPLKEVYFYGLEAFNMDLQTNSKTLVMVFLGIAVLILVVSMLNYINMSVSQAGFRGKEAATKKLLGCPRSQLVIQLLAESIIMTGVAFVVGLLLAFAVEPFFDNVLKTQVNLSGLLYPSAILFIVACIVLIGLISGLAPALIISQFNPLEVVKGTFSRKIKSTYSKVLIIFQYTVAIALLISSVFILLQTRFLKNHDLGFDREAILVMQNVMGERKVTGLKDRLKAVAGVENVSFVAGNPLEGGNNNSFVYNGEALSFDVFVVDSAFFDIFKIKITPTGVARSADNAWLVNPKGFAALQPDTVSYTVKIQDDWQLQIWGVTNEFNFRPLQRPVGLAMLRMEDNNEYPWSIVVKLSPATDLHKTVAAVKETYFSYNGQQPFDIKFSDDIIQQWYERETNTTKIIAAFTFLTIVILVMGIFAMSLYFIRQKEREIAIRKINGAKELQIISMLNRLFVVNVLVSFVIATPIAYFAIDRWLQNFAYNTPIYWWVFVLSGLAILLLSILTISWQAYKAATTNPATKVKAE